MSLALRHRASLLGAALLLALAASAAPPAPPPPSLEQLYRVQPWRGEPAKEPAFSRSGRYLAYLWNAHGEPGSDLHLHDIKTGKTLRLSSPHIMAGFDSPEELKRFDEKRAQRDREWSEAQAKAEAQQAYLRGERVDLGQWEREALAKLKEEAAAKRLKDEAQKAADKLEAEAEKRAMAELAARRAGKALPPPAPASAPADKPTAAEPQKEDWEWRDELKKQLAKHKLKATDLYPGVTQIVWAHERDELIFQYRGHLFRWQAANGDRIEPLVQTQRQLRAVAYTRDDLGFVYLDEGRLLRQRFAGGAVQVLNRELFNPDDAERKYRIEASSLSEDGRWMALTARAPQEPGEDGKPAPKPGRQVEIMDYTKRFATAKKVDREVSDDKRIQPPTAIYIRPVPQGAEPPAKQPEPVFTHKGGDVWFELSPVALSRDGSRYAFASWEREKELLRVYMGRSGEAKPELVLERRGDVGHEVINVLRPQFTPDGQTLVLNLDEAGWRQPHGIDVASKALRPLVKGEFEAHQVLGFSLDSKAMFVLANKDDLAAMNVYRVDLASGAMTALGQSPDYHRNATVSKDGRLAAAVAGHWGSRPELKLLQAGQAAKVLTASHDPLVAQIDRLRPERFSFKNRHGDSLQAYLFKPPGWQASDRRPAIVYVYGGPLNDRHIVETDSFQATGYLFNQYMALTHGYVTVSIDTRGHSNYGRRFSAANWEQPGRPQTEDLEDLHQELVKHWGVDGARVGLNGWSFGGFQTQYTMYTRPDLFAAGIAGAGPTEWENYNSWYSGRTIGKVDRSKPNLRKHSLLPLAPGLKKPLMLVHGMMDPNVLYQDTVNVYRALLESGKAALVELFLDPDGEHAMGGAVKPAAWHRKYEAFWLRVLGRGQP